MRDTNGARLGLPDLGVGVGLRIPHYGAIFGEQRGAADPRDRVDWFEIISENFMVAGGPPLANLSRVLERWPVVQHGVSLSVGGREPLDRDYLARLKALMRRTRAPWFGDHLCWTGVGGKNLHDLLPLPYTDEAVEHVAVRIREVQDAVEARFVVENVSSYMTYTSSAMPEWDFLSAVAERADCGVLLDVNNVYVSAMNHGFDPRAYLDGVPHARVAQMHLAGHADHGDYIIDTHGDHVAPPVWELYRVACELCGPVSTLIEWDDDIPSFETLVAEADKARVIRDEVCGARAA